LWPDSGPNVIEKEAAVSFFDRLFGRGKTAAADIDHNSVKGESMHEEQEIVSSDDGTAFPADPTVLAEGEFLEAQLADSASDDPDPQVPKDAPNK
jgi:hypothetical protein